MDKQGVEWSRDALVLLEARLADMRGGSARTRQAFVTDLADSATPAEALQKAAGKLVGMLNVAFKLLIELEGASELPAETWLRSLGDWLTTVEAEASRAGGGNGQNPRGGFSLS